MTTRCPTCFLDLRRSAAAYVCTNEQCAEKNDPRASAYLGEPTSTRPVMTAPNPTDPRSSVGSGSAPCTTCGKKTTATACPRCHVRLPTGWMYNDTTCIAMAGARASGKSIYIAVLKRQIELWAESMGTSLRYLDLRTEQIYTKVYQQPLYEHRGLVAATARHETAPAFQRYPLLFALGSAANGRQHVLVIRDVAGENLEDRDADQTVFGFFRDADGIIFLFDPMRVEEIRQQLVGVVPEQRALGGDPVAVLENVARLADPGEPRVRTPLAVALAKFDTLYELRRVAGSPLAAAMRNAGAAYSRDPSLNSPQYDEHDGALLDAEIRSLLARMNGQALINRIGQQFARTRLFAVSALGAAPTGQSLNARGITPFRCLDPLKWIMSISSSG
jgi:hypothetical protein